MMHGYGQEDRLGKQNLIRPSKCLLSLLYLIGGCMILVSPLAADSLYEESPHGLSAGLKMVRTLIKADVLDLAESMLETQSPAALPTDEWLAWEKQLWSLYGYRGKWQELYNRAIQVPPSFPASIRNEALDQAVAALLEQGRGKEARHLLIGRILSEQDSDNALQKLRKLVIKSYLVDGLFDDAASSMSSYQRDYRASDEDWLILRAQVYLKIGQPDQAINLLAPVDLPRAKLLTLYARLVHGSISPSQAIEILDNLLYPEQGGDPISGLREVEATAVEAYANQRIDPQHFISKLEHHLIVKGEASSTQEGAFPSYSLFDLFAAYEKYALQVIGEREILENEFNNILEYTLDLPDSEALQQRVLSAYLLRRVQDQYRRTLLCDLLVTSLLESGNIEIMAQLFRMDTPFGELSLSGEVGLMLSNAMIDQGHVQLAAMTIDSMAESSALNIDPERWMLHKARISVVAGRFAGSFQQLRQLIVNKTEISAEEMDDILVPIFDLQKFRQHEYALELLGLLRSKITTKQQDRELTYWIGESYQAIHQYLTAANYFLYSALLKGDGYDPWGVSARYFAAKSLESAHLYSDAKTLYQNLRSHTKDEARLIELDHKIQELSLWEASGFDFGEGLNEGEN